jgi:hypothetical protein
MRLKEIIVAVDGEIVVNPPSELDLVQGFASDLMSDVLHLAKPHSLLITGLTNIQSIRTAEMADLPAILFVRGKCPPPEVLELAKHVGIAILLSPYTMFETCGQLFRAGLLGQGKVDCAPESARPQAA